MLVSMAMLVAGARRGQVVSFGTDTVPALAVVPEKRDRIFALKQRPADKPLILMASSIEQLWQFIDTDNPAFCEWEAIARRYLPGALTLVLPVNNLGQQCNPNFVSLGVRIPKHQGAITILQQTGVLLTTSANVSGSAPLLSMQAISDQFPEVLVWQDNQVCCGQPSTVIAWQDGGWQILRMGAIKELVF